MKWMIFILEFVDEEFHKLAIYIEKERRNNPFMGVQVYSTKVVVKILRCIMRLRRI